MKVMCSVVMATVLLQVKLVDSKQKCLETKNLYIHKFWYMRIRDNMDKIEGNSNLRETAPNSTLPIRPTAKMLARLIEFWSKNVRTRGTELASRIFTSLTHVV